MSPHRILLLTAPLAILAGCGDCGKPAAPAREAATAHTTATPVRTLPLTRASTAAEQTIPASVRSAHRAELAPRLAGTWSDVLATTGDTVTAGQPLARIHAPEWAARLAAAEAAVAAARADFARSERLRRADAATPAEFDAATARLRTAEAALTEARSMNNETTLVAPFAGTLAAKAITAGDAAMPGRPAFVLEDPNVLEVETALPESLAATPKIGDTLTAEVRGVTLRLTLTEVVPSADPQSRTRSVRAALTPQHLKRLPARPATGEFARVWLPAAGDESRLIAPAEAVTRRGQLESVWISADGKAALRLVRTGRVHGDSVEILSGLSGNETLIAPTPELREGASVK